MRDRWDTQLDQATAELKIYCESRGLQVGQLQAVWRGGVYEYEGSDELKGWGGTLPEQMEYTDLEWAILDALVIQGSIPAWRGDGLSCAAQIAWFIYQQMKNKVDDLEHQIKILKNEVPRI